MRTLVTTVVGWLLVHPLAAEMLTEQGKLIVSMAD